jgi:gamma-glutamyltranspeptidase/glutathione hydrolase
MFQLQRLVLGLFIPVWLWAASARPIRAEHGLVVSSQKLASAAGVEIMKKGGNAVDAAVATGFALAVVHPTAGNIGGGGFMVIRFADGKAVTIDYREMAPARAHRDMYLTADGSVDEYKSQVGYLAAGVPGSVAGLCHALVTYGSLPLKTVMKPAIRLADKGFHLSEDQARSFARLKSDFSRFPSSKKVFLKSDGTTYEAGELFRQPDLARTLKEIARSGGHAFYEGRIAELIEADMAANGGLITRQDLAAYRAIERPPIMTTFHDVGVISMAPPSSGGIALAEMLNMLEMFDLKSLGHNSSAYVHVLSEAMKRAFADRAEFLGDPDFVQVPAQGLLSKSYARSLFASFNADKATPADFIKAGDPANWHESEQTTHYSVADRNGTAVAVTTTLNGSYGSYAVVAGAGFLLNNEMDDFAAKPGSPNMYELIQSEANAIVPGKRMLSSMTPTILVRNGQLYLIIGSPGGPTIINTVLQVVLNVAQFNMDIQEAIDAPRFHHQWFPDEIRYERDGLVKDVLQRLTALGHKTADRSVIGEAEGIVYDQARKIYWGAADGRGEGTVVGY